MARRSKLQRLMDDSHTTPAASPADADAVMATLVEQYEVPRLGAKVRDYVVAIAAVDRVEGPYDLRGVGAGLEDPQTCEGLFGVLGDRPFPAVRIGSDRAGVDFWLVLTSGRVITLHRDASLYEEAAQCSTRSVGGFVRDLTKRGSAMDVVQLVTLQAQLGALTWNTDAERQAAWARTAAQVLSVSLEELVHQADTLPLEMLHLEPTLVDELAAAGSAAKPKKETPTKPKKKRSTKKLLPPLQEALEANATSLDLRGLLGKTLPAEVLELTELEELDLSHNPKLDFDKAFAALSQLPRLREVRFRDCRLESLPTTITELQTLERVNLSGVVFKGPGNYFDLDAELPKLAALPRLRRLTARVAKGTEAMLPHLEGMDQLEELDLSSVVRGPSWPLSLPLGGHPALKKLWLGKHDVGPLIDADPDAFPQLEELHLNTVSVRDRAVGPDVGIAERMAFDAAKREDLGDWLARLPALRVLSLSFDGRHAIPAGVAGCTELRELALGGREIPPWIGALQRLERLTVRGLRGALPDVVGELTQLRELDLGRRREMSGIDALPETIGKLTRLKRLAIGSCKLAEWPASLRALDELEVLITGQAPPFLPELTTLRDADGPAEALVQLPKLERIELRGAHVPPATADHPSLREVVLTARALEEPEADALERIFAIPHLERLELSAVAGPKLPDAIRRTQIRHLTLRRSSRDSPGLQWSEVLPALRDLPLETLSLSSDPTCELPSSIAQLTGLRELTLKGGFADLPSELDQLSRLRHLQLWKTRIRAPARNRLKKALPGCRITVRD